MSSPSQPTYEVTCSECGHSQRHHYHSSFERGMRCLVKFCTCRVGQIYTGTGTGTADSSNTNDHPMTVTITRQSPSWEPTTSKVQPLVPEKETEQ